jgi:hypothetical protein
LDLGPRARVVFALAYLALQGLLVGYGLSVPDHVFGFQMFNESSRIRISLFRQVRGRRKLVPVRGGTWEARDEKGGLHTFHWDDRVHYYVLRRLDGFVPAAYGLEAQRVRLQQALDDVATHIPEDAETEALVAVVDASKNGREPERFRLTGVRP